MKKISECYIQETAIKGKNDKYTLKLYKNNVLLFLENEHKTERAGREIHFGKVLNFRRISSKTLIYPHNLCLDFELKYKRKNKIIIMS